MYWADGDSTAKTFTIAIAGDDETEKDETFDVWISNAVGATLGTQSTAVVTIDDNDSAVPQPLHGAELGGELGGRLRRPR